MGNHVAGRAIVECAIALSLANPSMPPLDILDRAVSGHELTDAEFESTDPRRTDRVHPLYDDERYLPSPFGELLRRAFAPDLDAREMLFATERDSDDPGFQRRVDAALDIWWKRVIGPFNVRYGLW